MVGTLTLEIVTQNHAEKRPLRVASVWERYGTASRRKVAPPLFDAELLRITPKGLWLRGYQIDAKDGKRIQYAQEWWCEVMQSSPRQ